MAKEIKNWLDLCDEIDDGLWDDGLDEIGKAVISRREISSRRTARRLMRSLTVGTKVKLGNGVKPRYLDGMVGTVERLVEGAAIVLLDRMPTQTGAGRPPEGGFKQKLTVPLTYLIQIADIDSLELGSVNMAADIGDDAEYEEDDDDD